MSEQIIEGWCDCEYDADADTPKRAPVTLDDGSAWHYCTECRGYAFPDPPSTPRTERGGDDA